MKIYKENDEMPKEMADIKSGKIFEVPPGYFDQLSKQLFDQSDHRDSTPLKSTKIKSLQPWLVAASFAVLITLGWWYSTNKSVSSINNIAVESELSAYIQQEIMEYDLEALSLILKDEDLYSLTEDDQNPYKIYIEEHFEDFDDILY